MIKFVKFSINDVLFDSREVSDAINKACSRKVPAKVAGLCQLGDTLIIPLEETGEDLKLDYVVAPFTGINEDEYVGEMKSRYYAGFSTVGVFSIAERKWALYSKEKSLE